MSTPLSPQDLMEQMVQRASRAISCNLIDIGLVQAAEVAGLKSSMASAKMTRTTALNKPGMESTVASEQMQDNIKSELESTVSEKVRDSIKDGLVRTQMESTASEQLKEESEGVRDSDSMPTSPTKGQRNLTRLHAKLKVVENENDSLKQQLKTKEDQLMRAAEQMIKAQAANSAAKKKELTTGKQRAQKIVQRAVKQMQMQQEGELGAAMRTWSSNRNQSQSASTLAVSQLAGDRCDELEVELAVLKQQRNQANLEVAAAKADFESKMTELSKSLSEAESELQRWQRASEKELLAKVAAEEAATAQEAAPEAAHTNRLQGLNEQLAVVQNACMTAATKEEHASLSQQCAELEAQIRTVLPPAAKKAEEEAAEKELVAKATAEEAAGNEAVAKGAAEEAELHQVTEELDSVNMQLTQATKSEVAAMADVSALKEQIPALKKANEQLTEANEQLTEANKQLSVLQQQATEAPTDAQSTNTMTKDISRLKQALSAANDELSASQTSMLEKVSKKKQALKASNDKCAAAEAQAASLTQQLTGANQQVTRLKDHMAKSNDETSQLHVEMAALQAQGDSSCELRQSEIVQLKDAIAVHKAQSAQLKDQIDSNNEQPSRLQAESLESTTKSLASTTALTKQVEVLQGKLAKGNEDVMRLQMQLVELGGPTEIKAAAAKLQTMEKENGRLKDQLAKSNDDLMHVQLELSQHKSA